MYSIFLRSTQDKIIKNWNSLLSVARSKQQVRYPAEPALSWNKIKCNFFNQVSLDFF